MRPPSVSTFVYCTLVAVAALLSVAVVVQDWDPEAARQSARIQRMRDRQSNGQMTMDDVFYYTSDTGRGRKNTGGETDRTWGTVITDCALLIQVTCLMFLGPGPRGSEMVLRIALLIDAVSYAVRATGHAFSPRPGVMHDTLLMCGIVFSILSGVGRLYAAQLALLAQGKRALGLTSRKTTIAFATFLVIVLSVLIAAKAKGRIDNFYKPMSLAKRLAAHVPLALYAAAGGALGCSFCLLVTCGLAECLHGAQFEPFASSDDFNCKALAQVATLLVYAIIAKMFEEFEIVASTEPPEEPLEGPAGRRRAPPQKGKGPRYEQAPGVDMEDMCLDAPDSARTGLIVRDERDERYDAPQRWVQSEVEYGPYIPASVPAGYPADARFQQVRGPPRYEDAGCPCWPFWTTAPRRY
uniref:Uncharacterized protein n=1 Tax=Zooxanthella nutricula TaxID=1333877 RepID=A0A6U6KBV2_9DINO